MLTLPLPANAVESCWCVTRGFLKPSVLVDLHVKGPAVLMAGPVRCASRRMSVSRHTSPLEPRQSGLDAPACAVMASPGHTPVAEGDDYRDTP